MSIPVKKQMIIILFGFFQLRYESSVLESYVDSYLMDTSESYPCFVLCTLHCTTRSLGPSPSFSGRLCVVWCIVYSKLYSALLLLALIHCHCATSQQAVPTTQLLGMRPSPLLTPETWTHRANVNYDQTKAQILSAGQSSYPGQS